MSSMSQQQQQQQQPSTVLIIEPFYGGSHRQLIDYLVEDILPAGSWHLVAMSAKKWHWRARCSALHVSQLVTDALKVRQFSHLFCSSVLSLAELIGLCPSLASCRKLVYFHENQLVYPVRKTRGERDFQYGYNQILSALSADLVLFNSEYNRDSFVKGVDSFLNAMPDYRTKGLGPRIAAKSRILHLPIVQLSVDVSFEPDGNKLSTSQSQHSDQNVQFPTNQSQMMNQDVHFQASQSEQPNQDEQFPTSQSEQPNQDVQFSTSQSQQPNREVQFPTNQSQHADQNVQLSTSQSQHADQNVQFLTNQSQHADQNVQLSTSQSQHADQNEQFPTSQSQQPNLPFLLNQSIDRRDPLLILWPHRWEHDKNPDAFFSAIFALTGDGDGDGETSDGEANFALCVLGQSFSGPAPPAFEAARARLPASRIAHWGYLENRADYYRCLTACHVVVSTAEHEFFGLAMLEATAAGCYPLAPKRLAYPELLPSECLYSTEAQLVKRLRWLCRGGPALARQLRNRGDFQQRLDRLRPEALRSSYQALFH